MYVAAKKSNLLFLYTKELNRLKSRYTISEKRSLKKKKQ
jgi:hypothetical protein